MLFQHLIYSARTHPWRLAGFIVFLMGLVVLILYVTTREYRRPEDSFKNHLNPTIAVIGEHLNPRECFPPGSVRLNKTWLNLAETTTKLSVV
jgi:hypothetical protein